LIFFQSFPSLSISCSTDRLQVFLGLRLLLMPCRFHTRSCLDISSSGFLHVCPIHDHLQYFIIFPQALGLSSYTVH
jgi:hypothetical protein